MGKGAATGPKLKPVSATMEILDLGFGKRKERERGENGLLGLYWLFVAVFGKNS